MTKNSDSKKRLTVDSIERRPDDERKSVISLDPAVALQIKVLKAMVPIVNPAEIDSETADEHLMRLKNCVALDVNEIADRTDLKDPKEVQRYLFILEGQKLVTPVPPSDLTSRVWQITAQGKEALTKLSRKKLRLSSGIGSKTHAGVASNY